MSLFAVHQGDALAVLRTMPENSVDCVVTSPPYWGLRDYGVAEQIGLEPTPQAYVARVVAVFREVRRVLHPKGTVWLNLGDSYCAAIRGSASPGTSTLTNPTRHLEISGAPIDKRQGRRTPLTKDSPHSDFAYAPHRIRQGSLKPKDMVGIPWRVAFALQEDGWYLRSDIVWSKPNPMPESMLDRPTKAHEYVFLFSKSGRYYYDADAIREPHTYNGGLGSHHRNVTDPVLSSVPGARTHRGLHKSAGTNSRERVDRVPRRRKGRGVVLTRRPPPPEPGCVGAFHPMGRNKRTVWTIATKPFPGAHFAVMPEALVEPCIRAGCKGGGLVLDPFAGSGTVGIVALREGCRFVGIELNPEYAAMARRRLRETTPALSLGAAS